MENRSFSSFMSGKTRDSAKKLRTLMVILRKSGFEVENFLDDQDEPHLFVRKTEKKLSFEGVRFYWRANNICYRCQMKKDVEPFGNSYTLDIQSMYQSLMGEKKAPYKIIFFIIKEMVEFFKRSVEAEKDSDNRQISIIALSGSEIANDYSNQNSTQRDAYQQ